MLRSTPVLVMSCLALAGCTAGPDYVRPAAPSSPALEAGAFVRAGEATAMAAPHSHWWRQLDDAVLSALIEEGLEQAASIAAAEARLRQARSEITTSRAALLPVLSSTATYVYADLPNEAFGTAAGGDQFFTVGFDARWEADLWGGNARAIERARAGATAARARLADVRVSLSAEIARAYVALRARQESERLLARREAVEVRLTRFAEQRIEGGTATRQELALLRRQLGVTIAERAALEAEIATLHDALAGLIGRAPGMLTDLSLTGVPLPPAEIAIGDPATLLARRPDVQAAESRLAAATAGIGMAQAQRFPSISLFGLIGIGGSRIGDVFDTSQRSAIAVPRLNWTFLDFGRTGAAVTQAEAQRDAALAEYRASVLAALQDAEAALARFGAARIAFARANESTGFMQEAARLEDMRADAGTLSRADALGAERHEIDAEIAQVNSRADLTLSYVALTKALGLGWQVQSALND